MTVDAALHPILIRPARPDDADGISALIRSLARYFLADPDDPCAAAAFFETLAPAAILAALESERYRYHVAEAHGALTGVVGVRDEAHLYHLFVAEPFHGRGIGARLWDTARAEALAQGNSGAFTVNSSRHAIIMYERMGFQAAGELQSGNGIAWLPMRLSLDATDAPR